MFLLSPEADWASEEVDSLSSDQRAAVVLIIRASRSVYPPANCRYTEPASSVRVPLDKVEPRTDPEVSEELEEWRRLRYLFIILEIYYMSGLLVWSLITVTVLSSPHQRLTEIHWQQLQTESDKMLEIKRKETAADRDHTSRTLQSAGERIISQNKYKLTNWICVHEYSKQAAGQRRRPAAPLETTWSNFHSCSSFSRSWGLNVSREAL